LQFSLKEIRTILDDPGFDQKEALRQQIRLLELQKERIGRLISYAQKQMEEGDTDMDFDTFDREELDRYKEEVKQRWGGTEAYRESEGKAASGVQPDAEGLMAIFRELGAMKTSQPEDRSVQEKVKELQDHISQHFYTCTKEILKGLGEMYAEDERFRLNIDKAGGEGTAVFVRDAIRIYCSRN
ncbi:MAG: TipAS antibiotic-recognition domain-containing protein, partial [Firmicutes bacterium]|nr:TipAS antibiotic-recognition domain-containing protein [Bacillota bacterium]